MMSEVLSYLIMITCILIRVSSKEVKWTVRNTSPKLGQDLTLFCKVDNCTVHETKRWHGGPDDKVLMLNSGISTDKTKYSTSIEKNGFILTILNLTVKDLNISYTCSCGLDLDTHILYIEDVYTVDNLNKTTNGTNYIGTNDVGGISLYVYIAIPVILVILLIIVIVVSKGHWLSGRLKKKTATESVEPSASWKDLERVDNPNVTVPLLDSNPGQSSERVDNPNVTVPLLDSNPGQSSERVDNPNVTVPLLDSNPGQSSERVDNPNVTVPLLDSNPGQSSGNMNQVPPGSYSLPSPKLVQKVSRPQSEKTSLTNKPEIIPSEIENQSSSSKGDNSNDTSALQQTIERLEDEKRKLKEEFECYKSDQTDNTGPYHTDTEKQVEKPQSDNDKLQEECDNLKQKNHQMSDLLEKQQLKKERDTLQTQLGSVNLELEDCQNKLTESQTNNKLLKEQTTNAINDFNELVKKYQKEMDLRKKYHNELAELKGNIRVFCRVRPIIEEDGVGPMANDVVDYDQDNDGLIYVSNKTHKFEVDKVFKQRSPQKEVFDEVKALVISCIDGYNVCIFAYGQSGSGKTFTMEGSTSDPGINPKALEELFNEASAKGDDWSFIITVSFIEIYNEIIRDLLSDNLSNKMKVKMNPDGGLYVPGLSLVVVKTMEDVNKQCRLGQRNRTTGSTNMNKYSSRSHAFLCVTVTGVNKTTNIKTMGKLNLVDLAGSESVSKSGAVGTRLKEAQNINKSLSSLRTALNALKSKQKFVQYRDSNLTRLLQDSLGGNSKTVMIVQVAPVQKHVAETLSSLNFAQSVRTVELGQASKKKESGDVKMDPVHTTVRQQQGTPFGSTTPNQSTPSKGSTPVAAKYPRRK